LKDEDASHTEGYDDDPQGNAFDDDQLLIPTTSGGGGGPMSFLPFRHSSVTTPSNDGPSARGDIDLLKEQASISASYGHSGAPTPFALSIKVLSQTKWKLCFDSHQELVRYTFLSTLLSWIIFHRYVLTVRIPFLHCDFSIVLL
jgi:hypothetical protein